MLSRGEPDPDDPGVELTLRGICLGAVITVVFISANVYLGLKTGITFSSSIPAAVMSMGLLKLLGGGGILENNVVQTQASAAGTLCNVNLVLPGLVLIHHWTGFPLWQTTAVCLLGGLLGVAFSVPLRRVMVVDSKLPFPEGVAAAEVLRSGHEGQDGERGHDGSLRYLGVGAAGAGIFCVLTNGVRLLPEQIGGTFRAGHAAFRLQGSLSLALIGIGYLVRLGCCLALLIGIVIAWGIAVPMLTVGMASGDPTAAAEIVWADKVRLIGAGLIAVAGLWTVATLVKPIVAVLAPKKHSPSRKRARSIDRDVPMVWVGLSVAGLLVPLAVLFAVFVAAHTHVSLLVLVSALTLVTTLLGFFMATACGYLAGLLGSSSSPISGIGILTVMLVAALGLAVLPAASADDARFIGALSIFVTSVIITASSIANDNLQDLKAGQLVGATPWKQQVALAIGVVLGAVTVAPVLQLLFSAYGFPGILPRASMDPHAALPAPQAALLAQIAEGIVRHRLDWTMIMIGSALGVVFVALETMLRRRSFTLPALSVGIGMYLPCAVVLTIALGGVVGWLAERRVAGASADAKAALRRRGVLLASGFLVGESVVGILLALSDVLQAKSDSLAIHGIRGGIDLSALASIGFAMLVFLFFRSLSHLRQ